MSSKITTRDTLAVRITVQTEAGAGVDLTGATCAAVMLIGPDSIAGTVTVLDAAAGLVRVTFPAAGDQTGVATAMLHVTRGAETQTVWAASYTIVAGG